MIAHVAALLLYGALTLALTWPLVTQLGGLVPHDLGDPLVTTWTLWWNSHALPFSDEWWDGLAFFPAPATLTYTDHRVGLGLLTTPLIWSGASPLAAHNVAFLASFFLSASSAYALCFVLTRSPSASFIGGLVFGFNPFRAEHLPHLELLSAYWLPIVLVALHQWASTRRVVWLGLVAVSLTMQALTCGYYFFYAGVLVALWLFWFLPRAGAPRQYVGLAVALLAPLVLLAPVLITYRMAHQAMGLSRPLVEIEMFSADLLGLITAPDLLAFWNVPREWLRLEGAIMPGLTAVLVTAAAVMMRRSTLPAAHDPRVLSRARTLMLLAAIVMTMVAMVPAFYGPVGFDLGGVRISSSSAYKPLSVAAVFFTLWLLSSRRVRDAWRRQSPFAFFVLATIAMWAFALGPTARFFGQRVLYKAPYSWLMLLPGFRDEFRAPARFAMLAALTLSVAAALAFCKLSAGQSVRVRLAAALLVGAAVTVESWIEPMPLVPAPGPLEIPLAVAQHAVVAELPFGVFEDGIAMYHAMSHHRPILNGLSGYDPPHHAVMRAALQEGEVEALTAVATSADVAIFVQRTADGAKVSQRLSALTTARLVGETHTHEVLVLRHAPDAAHSRSALEGSVAIRELASAINPADLPRMMDGDRGSAWETGAEQRGGEAFTADLGGLVDVTGVVLGLGGYTTAFPRAIDIDTSIDGSDWIDVWRGSTAAKSVAAALANPREVPVVFEFAARPARYVRITQVGRSQARWAVAELSIRGRAPARQPLLPPRRRH